MLKVSLIHVAKSGDVCASHGHEVREVMSHVRPTPCLPRWESISYIRTACHTKTGRIVPSTLCCSAKPKVISLMNRLSEHEFRTQTFVVESIVRTNRCERSV